MSFGGKARLDIKHNGKALSSPAPLVGRSLFFCFSSSTTWGEQSCPALQQRGPAPDAGGNASGGLLPPRLSRAQRCEILQQPPLPFPPPLQLLQRQLRPAASETKPSHRGRRHLNGSSLWRLSGGGRRPKAGRAQAGRAHR